MAWLPLESNPEVMSRFLWRLGVPEPWRVVDVYGLDAELLAMVPRPAAALMLLFPMSRGYEELRAAQEARARAEGRTAAPPGLFYMRQVVSNACGTVALIHAVANNTDKIQLRDGGVLQRFLEAAAPLSPEERAALLAEDDGVAAAHRATAEDGETAMPAPGDPINLHFVTLVASGGSLWELDGLRAFPVDHGATSEETFVEDAARVVREYVAREPGDIRFTVSALAADN